MANLKPIIPNVNVNTQGALNNLLQSYQKQSNAVGSLGDVFNQAKENERKTYERKRQARLDARNQQLFDLKMQENNRLNKQRADEEAYLKGITKPDSYGLKSGTNKVVESLGNYGENSRSKDALAAGPGSKEYEQYFKEMEDLGNTITGQSMDDRTIGFATANPDNIYAAREALKADLARKSALDAEAKSITANKLKYELEALKSGSKNRRSTGKTSGGYKVESPGNTLKEAFNLINTQYSKEDSIDPRVAKQATLMANAGYDSAQIAKAVNESFIPSKRETFLGIDWLNPDSKAEFNTGSLNIGAPRNVEAFTNNTEYTNKIRALSKSFDNRLDQVQEQRDGEVGLSQLEKILRGTSEIGSSGKTRQDTVRRKPERSSKNIENQLNNENDENVDKGEYGLSDWSSNNLLEMVKELDPKEDPYVYSDYINELKSRGLSVNEDEISNSDSPIKYKGKDVTLRKVIDKIDDYVKDRTYNQDGSIDNIGTAGLIGEMGLSALPASLLSRFNVAKRPLSKATGVGKPQSQLPKNPNTIPLSTRPRKINEVPVSKGVQYTRKANDAQRLSRSFKDDSVINSVINKSSKRGSLSNQDRQALVNKLEDYSSKGLNVIGELRRMNLPKKIEIEVMRMLDRAM